MIPKTYIYDIWGQGGCDEHDFENVSTALREAMIQLELVNNILRATCEVTKTLHSTNLQVIEQTEQMLRVWNREK